MAQGFDYVCVFLSWEAAKIPTTTADFQRIELVFGCRCNKGYSTWGLYQGLPIGNCHEGKGSLNFFEDHEIHPSKIARHTHETRAYSISSLPVCSCLAIGEHVHIQSQGF